MIYNVGQQKKYINISEGKKDFDITVVVRHLNGNIPYQVSIVSSEDIMQDDTILPTVKGTNKMRVQKTNSSEDWFVALSAQTESQLDVTFGPTTGAGASNPVIEGFSIPGGKTTWIILALAILLCVGGWFLWKKKNQNGGFTSKVNGGF